MATRWETGEDGESRTSHVLVSGSQDLVSPALRSYMTTVNNEEFTLDLFGEMTGNQETVNISTQSLDQAILSFSGGPGVGHRLRYLHHWPAGGDPDHLPGGLPQKEAFMSKRIRTLVIVAVAVVALLAASLGVAFLLPQETEEGDDGLHSERYHYRAGPFQGFGGQHGVFPGEKGGDPNRAADLYHGTQCRR